MPVDEVDDDDVDDDELHNAVKQAAKEVPLGARKYLSRMELQDVFNL